MGAELTAVQEVHSQIQPLLPIAGLTLLLRSLIGLLRLRSTSPATPTLSEASGSLLSLSNVQVTVAGSRASLSWQGLVHGFPVRLLIASSQTVGAHGGKGG